MDGGFVPRPFLGDVLKQWIDVVREVHGIGKWKKDMFYTSDTSYHPFNTCHWWNLVYQDNDLCEYWKDLDGGKIRWR